MTVLRWWAEKIGKQNVIARDNEHYGIAKRQYVTNVSQSRELTAGELAKVTDPYTRISLKLQAAFGLRREESIKIRPAWADRGDRLALMDTWTKGGREREIPIRTSEQRQVLEQAKQFAGRGSLIPKTMNYAGQLQRFKAQCMQAGIHKVHGHRHHYAQERYRDLTGRTCPAQGGPKSKQLTAEERDSRSPSARNHYRRAGPRPRTGHSGVSGAMTCLIVGDRCATRLAHGNGQTANQLQTDCKPAAIKLQSGCTGTGRLSSTKSEEANHDT